MYESTTIDRVQRRETSVPQYNSYSAYSGRVSNYSEVPNYTPNIRSTYQVPNDIYMQAPVSDNVAPVNNYEAQYMNQQVNSYQQAPSYQQAQNYQTYANNATYAEPTFNAGYQAPTYNYANTYQPTYTTGYQAQNYYAQAQNNVASYQYSSMDQAVYAPEYEKIAPQKSRSKNKMTKLLIAVYFFIIAVCATLIIVNVVAATGATEVSAATAATAAYSADTVYYTVDQNGNSEVLEKTAKVVDYEYDTTTNWFDGLCDKVGEIFG